jgi:hypothetical protein
MTIRKVSAVVRRLKKGEDSEAHDFKGALNEIGDDAPSVAGYAEAVAKAARGSAPDYELRLALESTRAAALRTADACERAIKIGNL